jgi:enoyl-CoA hydratase
MMSALPDSLNLRTEGAVCVLTLNRPDAFNAVDASMHAALGGVWRTIAENPEVRAIVVTGAGTAFSAGGDFAFMQEVRETPARMRIIEEGRRLIQEMLACPLPIVAAVNGPAVGLGASIAVLSDTVYIADNAHIADPHVLVGLVAGDGGAAMWPMHMSMLRAKEFLLTGDRIDPATAVSIGLANRVVPAADLFDESMALAQRLAKVSPTALQETKRALNMHILQAISGPMEYAIMAERDSMHAEAHTLFLDKQRAKAAARG